MAVVSGREDDMVALNLPTEPVKLAVSWNRYGDANSAPINLMSIALDANKYPSGNNDRYCVRIQPRINFSQLY